MSPPILLRQPHLEAVDVLPHFAEGLLGVVHAAREVKVGLVCFELFPHEKVRVPII